MVNLIDIRKNILKPSYNPYTEDFPQESSVISAHV